MTETVELESAKSGIQILALPCMALGQALNHPEPVASTCEDKVMHVMCATQSLAYHK